MRKQLLKVSQTNDRLGEMGYIGKNKISKKTVR